VQAELQKKLDDAGEQLSAAKRKMEQGSQQTPICYRCAKPLPRSPVDWRGQGSRGPCVFR
jgi:hypothetical protein